ncbi:MAG TPA: glycerophosphodiester phosphodiesterase family protein, partial [Kofleriaceae bacterium]
MPAVANPFLATKRRPLVVGHRGVPALHQENSLAGFRRAVALGVPAIECDVRLTRDGHAVVLHDLDLARLTGAPGLVHDLTWDQLARRRIQRALPMGIDARGEPVVVRYERDEPIARLDELLAEVGGQVAINVELKLDLPIWWRTEIGEVAAREIARTGAQDRVIVTSFDVRKLRAARRVERDLALGFCFDDSMLSFARGLLDRLPPFVRDYQLDDRAPGHNARRALRRLLGTGAVGRLASTRVVGAEHTLVGGDTVERMHRQGLAIGTHTLFPIGSTTGKPIAASAMTDAEALRLVALGVDWIETDDPERLMRLL